MSTMVMTGGTSGFGAIAAERLRSSGDTRLVLGARRPQPDGGDRESVALDLTSLESVRSFASQVRSMLGGTPIDALVLNAGVVRRDVDGRTADGFETTFGVNHLAHYLLLRLLLADLAEIVQPVLSTVFGSAASAVPGLQVASTVFTTSVISGTANAFLTLRVGVIAQEYSRALLRPARRTLRRAAVVRAAGMLGGIVTSGAGKVASAVSRATGRSVSGAITGVGRRMRDAGEAMASRVPFRRTQDRPDET